MNRDQKELFVTALKQDFEASNASFLISLKGIPVAKIQELRKGLKASGGKLKVAKNRLMKIAVDNVDCAKELTPFLKEQLGVVFSKNDPMMTAKILYKFSKENEKLKLVAGCFESKVIQRDTIVRIANLPSREILLSQICGLLKSSVVKLAQTLDALKEKKSQ